MLLPSEVRVLPHQPQHRAVQVKPRGFVSACHCPLNSPRFPWEYLDDDGGTRIPRPATETPSIRYLELARPPQPLTHPAPAPHPRNGRQPERPARAGRGRGKQHMAEAIQHLQDEGQVSLTWSDMAGSADGHARRPLARLSFHRPWRLRRVGAGRPGRALADDQGKANLLSATQFGRCLPVMLRCDWWS